MENKDSNGISADDQVPHTGAAAMQDRHSLLNDLQTYKLELEMQNDELKASYLTLDQEREKFVRLFDLAPVGYFIIDHLGRIEEVNQHGADLLNSTRQDLILRRLDSFIARESGDIFFGLLHRMKLSGGRQSAALCLCLPGGGIIYGRLEGRAVPQSAGVPLKYYIAMIDITDTLQAQQELKATTDRLEMTLNASSTGTWAVKQGTTALFLDEYCCKLLGIEQTAETKKLNSLLSLVHPDDRLSFRRDLLLAISENRRIDLEFRVLTPQGAVRCLAVKGQEIMPASQAYLGGTIMDITERKLMEAEAEHLRINQQKMILSATITAQEKERETISSVLHDSVSQVLYGIKLNLANIQKKLNDPAAFVNVNKLLDQAIRETRQLSHELTPIVLREFGFVAGIREMAALTSTPQFRVQTAISILADQLPRKVQLSFFRIIQELINNSIRHSGASVAKIKVSISGSRVKITVSDNGSGLAENSAGGALSGSGIRGIRNRVYLLNGKIDFRSTNRGLTVHLLFEDLPEPG